MLHVFRVVLHVFPVMLHVFCVMLQETRATLQETRATLHETRAALQKTRATLHETRATLHETCATLQDCTNSVPIVKNSQKQSNSKNYYWCTNRHMSTQSPPNAQSPRPSSASAEYTKPFYQHQTRNSDGVTPLRALNTSGV